MLIDAVGHSSVYELFSALHLTTRQKCSSAVHGIRKYTAYRLKSLRAGKWRFRWRLPQSQADLEADADNKAMEETNSSSSLQEIEAREPQLDAIESKARSLTGSALNGAPLGFVQHLVVCLIDHKHKQENQGLKSQEGAPHRSGSHF